MLPYNIIPPPPSQTCSKLDTASNTASLKKNNSAAKLKQRVWKQLFCFLNSREVNQADSNKIALLKSIRKQNNYGYLQREEILDRTVVSKNREQAHKLLVEACNELITNLSEDLGGAA